jgi:hypothetical protein
MKIAAVCCTFLRPRQLGHLIHCFLRQDYPAEKRELVILDDAGQYGNQEGDGWRLVSTPHRFPTLGEKRNAAAALVSEDVEALAVWDDDDFYLPWALRACAVALNVAPWSRPSLVLHPQEDGSLRQHQTGGLFHGGWAYAREVFRQVGGYRSPPVRSDPPGAEALLCVSVGGPRRLAPLADGACRLSAAGRPAGAKDPPGSRPAAGSRPGLPADPCGGLLQGVLGK